MAVSDKIENAKTQICEAYMTALKEEVGHVDYAYWNGLEKGFELGTKWYKAMVADAVAEQYRHYMSEDCHTVFMEFVDKLKSI